MRLVLVHGIKQQGRSEDSEKAEWLGRLTQTLGDPNRFSAVEVAAPFYGDVLYDLSENATPAEAVAQGFAGTDEQEALFLASGLLDIAMAAGVSQAQILRETQDAEVAQGIPHDRRFIAIVRLLERLSPFQGGVAIRILKQAYVYLNNPAATRAVDDIVRPVLERGPCVVVAHSLGTVVAFKLLRDLHQTVPLFLTMGSPLAIKAVQAPLKRPRLVPQGVGRWLNALDPDDFVTLGEGLTAETFAPGIENLADIDNPGDDAHAITGYLADRRVADAVSAAV